jgi:two-component sensor histidine kinase
MSSIGTAEEEAKRAALLATELAEAVHRARNDLGAIIAMLRLHAITAREPTVRAALDAAGDRVAAMARLNARLDASARGVQTITTIDASAFLSGLVEDLQDAARGGPIVVQESIEQQHWLPIELARPLGLIAAEWFTNALKYAFPDERHGTIRVSLSCVNSTYTMVVADDGMGMDPSAPPRGTGLGSRLVKALARQLRGEVEVSSSDVGTACKVAFPLS